MAATPWTAAAGISPECPKLLTFREQPLILGTATEHYGAVMNRPFRYDRYLADMAAKGMTVATVLNFDLPNAPFRASTCSPTSGLYSPGLTSTVATDVAWIHHRSSTTLSCS